MGHFKFRVLFSLLLAMGITGMLTGQNESAIKKVDLIEPFIKAEQVHLQLDGENNLWITTPVKVMRYNSNHLEDYNKFRGIPKDLGKQYTTTYTDSQGKTWLGGSEGLAVFKPKQDAFELVSKLTGKVYAFLEDEVEQLWVAAENGIFKLKVNSDKEDYGLSRFLSENTMATDIKLFRNKVIFAGPNGLLSIDLRSGKYEKAEMGNYSNLHITSILPLDRYILLGTREKGLYKIDSELRNVQKLYTASGQVRGKEITSIHELDDAIILTTRGAGAIRLDGNLNPVQQEVGQYPEGVYTGLLSDRNLFYFVGAEGLFVQNLAGLAVEKLSHRPGSHSSLPDNMVIATATDENGKIWTATPKGLSIYNPRYESWTNYTNLSYSKKFNEPDKISSILSQGEFMWIATLNDGVYRFNIHNLSRNHYSIDSPNKTKVQSATTLFADGSGNIWIGGKEGYLTCVKKNGPIKNYPLKDVNAIGELGPRKLIVAASNRVHSLDPYTGRIEDLTTLNASENLVYYGVNELKITHDGTGLFATQGAGLLIYDFEHNKVKQIDQLKGLPSQNVLSIKPLSEEGLWLSTDKGLAYFNRVTESVKVFTQLNGLSTNELTTGLHPLEDGTYVLGTSRGLNIFKPKVMLAQQEFKPGLKLMDASIKNGKNSEEMALGGKKVLKINDESALQLSFVGLSNLDPEAVIYSWKLEGYDKAWSKASPLTTANYSALPAGSYNFMVRSKLPNSTWTEPKQIKIEVEPAAGAFSAVYAFMGVGIIAMLGIFVFVFRRRSKQADLVAKAELRDQLEKEFRKPVENAVRSLSKVSAETLPERSEDLQRFAAHFDELFHQILNFNYEGSAFEITRIDIHRHLPQVLKEIEPVYKAKNLEMSVNDQWGGSEFYYNLEMLDKIFFSLISGSVGYSFKGGKIIVSLIETGVGDLKLQITDNGKGIPKQDLKALERNKAGTEGMRRDRSGLRYILKARDLINECGGSFSFETEKNEGSTFTAILKNKKEDYRKVPQRAAAIFKAEKVGEKIEEEVPKELKKLSESRILIIDNDTENRTLLVKAIGKYCQVYQAETGTEGLEKAGMIFPDTIITGSMLPDMDAIQLSKKLKRDPALSHISLFLVSEAGEFKEDQLSDFNQVLIKPVDIADALKKVSRILVWQQDLRSSYILAHQEGREVEYRNARDKSFIENLKAHIIENLDNENYSVHDLSAAMKMSSNALFMKLKNLVGLSPQDFMEFTRLNHAAELLASGKYNAMEVAYKSGFSSPTLFNSAYKRYYGYSLRDHMEKQ